ncbi:MG2 domain-containing protein [Candidatus Spyradosoma sp. SGI.093]|uniref:MG2 domain-containing protein n=1 Tax=Candidatus Spyradosoma sp. SGI.093 TaxID=3420583 RepID=UPI003D03DA7D
MLRFLLPLLFCTVLAFAGTSPARAADESTWEEYAFAALTRARSRAELEKSSVAEAKVRELRRELAEAPFPEARAILAVQLAHALRRLGAESSPRRAAANPVPEESTRERIFSEAIAVAESVFADADRLRATPLAAALCREDDSSGGNGGSGLLEMHDSEPAEFPTLYDFLENEVCDFLAAFSEEPGAADETRAEARAALRKRLRAWEAFHAADEDRSACARAVLMRLKTAEPFDADALRAFAKEFSALPIAAEACGTLARRLLAEGRVAEARRVAADAFEKYARHKSALLCRKVLAEIENPRLRDFSAERTWFDAESAVVVVRAKNVGRLHFRAVPQEREKFFSGTGPSPDLPDEALRRELLERREGVVAWSAELEKHDDFLEHSFRVPAPFARLRPGFYFLFVSPDPEFANPDRVACRTVLVSRLVAAAEKIGSACRGFFADAETGEPRADVEIRRYSKTPGEAWRELRGGRSDAQGFFELASGWLAYAHARAPEGDEAEISAGSALPGISGFRGRRAPIDRVFTDRAVYRAGDAVSFKAIFADFLPERRGSERLDVGEKKEIRLLGPNGELVARRKVSAGEFGSASGTFTIPEDAREGEYSLFCWTERHKIRVEAADAPSFTLALDVPETPRALGERVSALVSSVRFTGTPLAGAKVAWSVRTGENLPRRIEETMRLIADGEGELDADGRFRFEFPTETFRPVPPHRVPAGEEARKPDSRRYEIDVVVSDASGGTRATRRVMRVSEAAVFAKARRVASAAGSAVRFEIELSDADGRPLDVPAVFSVHARALPEKLGRSAPSPRQIALGEKLFETRIVPVGGRATAEIPAGTLPKNGAFVARVSDVGEARFEGGETTFETLDGSDGTRCPLQLPFVAVADAERAQVGDAVSFVWGSGLETARARVEIRKDEKTLRSFWTTRGNTLETIRVPVTPELLGGFKVRVAQVSFGEIHEKIFEVAVPEPPTALRVSRERFRTRLAPGSEETWTLRVTRADGTPAADAEVLALLYDRSLDAIAADRQPLAAFPPRTAQDRTPMGTLRPRDVAPTDFKENPPAPFPWNPKLSFRPIDWARGVNPWRPRFGEGRAFGFGVSIALGAEPLWNFDSEIELPARPAFPRATRETVFFLPGVRTDADGVARISFTVPEGPSAWRFVAFAHDKALNSGFLDVADVVVEESCTP